MDDWLRTPGAATLWGPGLWMRGPPDALNVHTWLCPPVGLLCSVTGLNFPADTGAHVPSGLDLHFVP